MASAGAGGVGPGQLAALALAMALLWLCPPLHAQLTQTPAAQPNRTPTVQPYPTTTEAACGRPAATGRILGGSGAPAQRWPWQAVLLYHDQHLCGAALIAALWVVSAAHCFQKSHEPRDYQVLLGYHKLHRATPHTLRVTVSQVIVHSDFNKHHFMGSDVALLQLQRPLDFTPYIRPACLPEPSALLPVWAPCWVTGWGMVSELDPLPPPLQLQEGRMIVMETRICNLIFGPPNYNGPAYRVHEDMLCAGTESDNTSICRGDSGGPLSCKLNDTWFLMGLSSWSLPCHSPVSPSVFTRVTSFSNWIREKQRVTPDPTPTRSQLSSFSPLGAVHLSRGCGTLVLSQALWLLLLSLRVP